MSKSAYVVPIVPSESVFKANIFNGKVLFCTGGGSGICRGMTEAMVSARFPDVITLMSDYLLLYQMRHGANAAIVGRKCVYFDQILQR